jgi:hypothetical protein
MATVNNRSGVLTHATEIFGTQTAYDRRVSSNVADDPRQLAGAKAKEIAGLSWEELDAYGKQVEDVVSPTGKRFRVKSIAFWDMDEWESRMYVIVRVYPTPRWHRFWGYSAVETRGDSDDPVPERPAS